MTITAMMGVGLAGFLFVGMLVMLEVGRHVGIRWRARHGDTHGEGLSAVEGAVFALLGLLIAFTFSGAAARFDGRRALIVEEANDIGTAYLRIDLLPPEAQPALKQKFREYTDARIATYKAMPDMKTVQEHLARSSALQGEIWQLAVASSEAGAPRGSMLLLPALNAMFDITTVRTWAAQTHPPPVIFAMLTALVLCCALFAGYGMSGAPDRNWLHVIGFCLVLSGAVFVIVDIEYPRMGFIRVDSFDQAIVQVRESMK